MTGVLEFLRARAQPDASMRDDSRRVLPGDIFFAYPGADGDGREHIAEAAERGAVAILWESRSLARPAELPGLGVANLRRRAGALAHEFYARPSSQLSLIAVTGTKGKTTVAWWCASLLSLVGIPCGYCGTLGCFAAGRQISEAGLTTPAAIELHGLLAQMLVLGCRAVALEVSSHALSQERLAAVDCDGAVFTGLGRDHFDYHGDEQSYVASKRLLFERAELDFAVINGDGAHAATMAAAPNCPVLTVGCEHGDVTWRRVPERGSRARIQLCCGAATYYGQLPALGEFNASNAALAFTATCQAGGEAAAVAAAFAKLSAPAGRMQRIAGFAPATYVDYAHTPESLAAALTALREEHPAAYLVCVFGCGGNRDTGKRPAMGRAASEADLVILTSDNSRDEDPSAIMAEISTGLSGPYETIAERAVAIRRAIAAAGPAGAVLVAGKGSETAMIGPAAQKIPFSDLAVARAALADSA